MAAPASRSPSCRQTLRRSGSRSGPTRPAPTRPGRRRRSPLQHEHRPPRDGSDQAPVVDLRAGSGRDRGHDCQIARQVTRHPNRDRSAIGQRPTQHYGRARVRQHHRRRQQRRSRRLRTRRLLGRRRHPPPDQERKHADDDRQRQHRRDDQPTTLAKRRAAIAAAPPGQPPRQPLPLAGHDPTSASLIPYRRSSEATCPSTWLSSAATALASSAR